MARRAADLSHSDRLAMVDQGTAWFLAEVEGMRDEQFLHPSLLPGWSRAHVVAHVGLNAEAIGNLVTWATTGVETPMYPDVATRNADIDELAQAGPGTIVERLDRACIDLDAALRAMPEDAWQAEVRTARGRPVAAQAILWMRAREVWLHAVDLGSGLQVGDLPEVLLEALVSDVLDLFESRGELTGWRFEVPERGLDWSVGPPDEVTQVRRLALPDLAAWLTGRDADAAVDLGDQPPLPPAPRWL